MLKFLAFHINAHHEENATSGIDNLPNGLPIPDAPDCYFKEDVTGEHFVLSEEFIRFVKESLTRLKPLVLPKRIVATVEEVMGIISLKKKGQNTWEDMVDEINSNYQKIMK